MSMEFGIFPENGNLCDRFLNFLSFLNYTKQDSSLCSVSESGKSRKFYFIVFHNLLSIPE